MSDDFDDPEAEDAWCAEQRDLVADYLKKQGVAHGRIGDWPGWHVAPHVAVWAIESATSPGHIGCWVISGDLPTDYVGREHVPDPRAAVRAFAARWRALAPSLARGEAGPEIRIGDSPEERRELAPLLSSRASLLADWAERDELWDFDED